VIYTRPDIDVFIAKKFQDCCHLAIIEMPTYPFAVVLASGELAKIIRALMALSIGGNFSVYFR
jgi:hypothetical protein